MFFLSFLSIYFSFLSRIPTLFLFFGVFFDVACAPHTHTHIHTNTHLFLLVLFVSSLDFFFRRFFVRFGVSFLVSVRTGKRGSLELFACFLAAGMSTQDREPFIRTTRVLFILNRKWISILQTFRNFVFYARNNKLECIAVVCRNSISRARICVIIHFIYITLGWRRKKIGKKILRFCATSQYPFDFFFFSSPSTLRVVLLPIKGEAEIHIVYAHS